MFSSRVTNNSCFLASFVIKSSSRGFTKRMSIKLQSNSSAISSAKFKREPNDRIARLLSFSLNIFAFPTDKISCVFSIFSPGPEPLGYLTATGPSIV